MSSFFVVLQLIKKNNMATVYAVEPMFQSLISVNVNSFIFIVV